MQRPLGGFEQVADVVEAQAGPERPEVARPDLEGRLRAANPMAIREREPQVLVDDFPEGLAGTPDLGLEPGRDVVIETQCRSHFLMLRLKHHDVN